MIARDCRLTRRAQFLRVAGEGTRQVSPGMILQACPMRRPEGAPSFRVGFTVSRKVGNAVIRNRVRRRLRAVAAAILPGAARPGFEYVIIGRQGAILRPYDLLCQDLAQCLRRMAP